VKPLYGRSEYVADWVAGRIPHMKGMGFGECQAIGVTHNDKLVAGVVFYAWAPVYRTIELGVAADDPRWATRDILNLMFSYAFETVGVNRCTCTTPADNHHTRRFNERLGMTLEGIHVAAYGDKDAAVYRLLRREWEAGKLYKPRQVTLPT
jgi:RimJ/RimL family protein N-acetyltransferase